MLLGASARFLFSAVLLLSVAVGHAAAVELRQQASRKVEYPVAGDRIRAAARIVNDPAAIIVLVERPAAKLGSVGLGHLNREGQSFKKLPKAAEGIQSIGDALDLDGTVHVPATTLEGRLALFAVGPGQRPVRQLDEPEELEGRQVVAATFWGTRELAVLSVRRLRPRVDFFALGARSLQFVRAWALDLGSAGIWPAASGGATDDGVVFVGGGLRGGDEGFWVVRLRAEQPPELHFYERELATADFVSGMSSFAVLLRSGGLMGDSTVVLVSDDRITREQPADFGARFVAPGALMRLCGDEILGARERKEGELRALNLIGLEAGRARVLFGAPEPWERVVFNRVFLVPSSPLVHLLADVTTVDGRSLEDGIRYVQIGTEELAECGSVQ